MRHMTWFAQTLNELKERVVHINKGIAAETSTMLKAHETPREVRQSLRSHDPPVSQCKGKRKPQRLKQKLPRKCELVAFGIKKMTITCLLVQRYSFFVSNV